MNYYQKKLAEKKAYTHKKPEDKSEKTLAVKMHRLQNPAKNAKLRTE